MDPVIRLAKSVDAAAIETLYAPIVRDTAISFELAVPDAATLRHRIDETLETFPWLVYERAGRIEGYAYAAPHRVREAYRWSVDVSVYVAASARRRGVGRALYRSLFAVLRLLGYWNAYAIITLPNHASVSLHEILAFEPIGVYRSVGYKLGSWHDTGHWQLALGRRPEEPRPPRALPALVGTPALAAALARGLEPEAPQPPTARIA